MQYFHQVNVEFGKEDNQVLERMARACNMTPNAMLRDIIIEAIHDAYIDYAIDEEED